MKKILFWCVMLLLVVFGVVSLGGGFYMLDYSLSPNDNRTDTAHSFRELYKTYPETKPWVDSLRHAKALRDTFLTTPKTTSSSITHQNRIFFIVFLS